jgi:predicted esterase
MNRLNTKKIFISLLSLFFGLSLSNCNGRYIFLNPAEYRKEMPYEYYVYAPSNYSPDIYWPIFIFIHGEGGSGLDCWNLFQKYADEEEYILVCPSLADSGGGWYQQDGETKLLSILNQIHKDYSAQSNVFLSGFSAGGQFVQGFAFTYSSYVAGVSVIAPGNVYSPSEFSYVRPFYVMVGDRDNPRIIEGSKRLVNDLSGSGYSVQYFEIPGVGHQIVEREIELTLDLYRSIFRENTQQ